VAAAGALCAAVLIAKAGVVGLPYHWDELGAYIGPAHWLAAEGLSHAVPGQYPPGRFYGHPTGYFAALAAAYRAFGESIATSHLFALAFACAGVVFTYLLGARIDRPSTGMLAAAFLFTTPIYFAQSAMALVDLPVAALGAACVYFALTRRVGAYIASGLLLATFKETALGIFAAVLVWIAVGERGDPRRWRRLVLHAVPALPLLAFFAFQKLTTGRFVTNAYFEDRAMIELAPAAIALGLLKTTGWILGAQHRWLLSLLIAAASWRRGLALWRSEFVLFASIGAAFAGAFAVIYVLPRYLLPVFPGLCVVAAIALRELFAAPLARGCAAAAVLALFASAWGGEGAGSESFSEDMQYVDVVHTHAAAVAWLEREMPERRIFALWPLADAISRPHLGYVGRPLELVADPFDAEILVTTPQGDRPTAALTRALEGGAFRPVQRFERRGKRVEIYAREHPRDARDG
jgi:4-amino-4-deoxy-L-arabinose transferase-like glycosyltransferase